MYRLLIVSILGFTASTVVSASAERFVMESYDERDIENHPGLALKFQNVTKDTETGLTWTPFLEDYNLEEFMAAQKAGEFKDWRLPQLVDLQSLFPRNGGKIPDWPPFVLENWHDGYLCGLMFRSGETVSEHHARFFNPFSGLTITERIDSQYVEMRRCCTAGVLSKDNPETFAYDREKVEQIRNLLGCTKVGTFLPVPKFNGHILFPHEQDAFPNLSFCPMTSFCFAQMTNADLQQIKVEVEIAQGYIERGNLKAQFSDINGFWEYYFDFLKLDKFTMAEKKEEFISRLITCRDAYSNEFKRYQKQIFLMFPFAPDMPVLQEDYNVDTKILTLVVRNVQNGPDRRNEVNYIDWGPSMPSCPSLFRNAPVMGVKCTTYNPSAGDYYFDPAGTPITLQLNATLARQLLGGAGKSCTWTLFSAVKPTTASYAIAGGAVGGLTYEPKSVVAVITSGETTLYYVLGCFVPSFARFDTSICAYDAWARELLTESEVNEILAAGKNLQSVGKCAERGVIKDASVAVQCAPTAKAPTVDVRLEQGEEVVITKINEQVESTGERWFLVQKDGKELGWIHERGIEWKRVL